MNNNQNQNITENTRNFLKGKGINPEKINSAEANNLFKNLSAEDQNKINNLLKGKNALEEILNSDKAKAIIKLFGAK